MLLTLMHNSSERNVIGKAISSLFSTNAIIKNDTSIIRPTFILQYDEDYLSDVNYVYCAQTKRYYFVNNITVLTGQRIELDCEVDVLQSFANEILSQKAIISKQENNGNLYYNDGSFVTDVRDFYTIKTFSNGFTQNGQYILITAGA